MSIAKRVALTMAGALLVTGCGSAGTSSAPTGPGGSAGAGGSQAPAGAALPHCLSFADIYAIVGPESDDVVTWADAATIAAELGSETRFPDGIELSITAPGEESGTFDSFVELVLAGPIEERGQPEDATTRLTQYQSSGNDNAIIDGIANTAGSFGWVGFAFYEESLDRVRAFAISEEPNGTCVEPTADTIADNSYPIARDLYIYVNRAKIAENPAVAAYVDFYLADGTIELALETAPYVSLGDALSESQEAWQAARAGATASPDGQVFVTGSSTVQPISQAVAEAFKAQNPAFVFTVEGPGTGDGFAKFCAGEADIADASRTIREDEIAECQAAGIDYVELKVAIDGIAVMTRK